MKKNNLNLTERAKSGRNGVQLVYVVEAIKDSTRAFDEGKEFATDADALTFFFDCFNKEFNDQYNKRDFPNMADRIGQYLQGLPSCISIIYWDDEIKKQGVIWGVLDSIEGRKAEKFARDWFNVLGLRLIQAAGKCGLNPYEFAV